MHAKANDAHRLQEIADRFYDDRISQADAWSAVIDVVADRLGCSRVSLWKFEGERPSLSLLCIASKVAGGVLETGGRQLTAAEFGDYFNALIERGVYASDDTLSDPVLQPMRHPYLLASGILSMLDAAFVVNGRAFGMVCCEETAGQRRWTAADSGSLRAIVNKLAMLMVRGGDRCLWDSPSLPLREFEPAQRAPSN